MNMRVTVLSSLLALALLGVWGCPPGSLPSPTPIPPTGVTQQFQVSRHTATPITAVEADQILADGSTILQVNDGPGDVVCNVGLVRNGGIGTFAAPQFINSAADMNAALALPGEIKVVDQINWCGGFSPNIIGCAPVPGNSLVVVRFNVALEGILWVHEFGHNQGLNHRNDPNGVMDPTIGNTRRRVNVAECTAYQVP